MSMPYKPRSDWFRLTDMLLPKKKIYELNFPAHKFLKGDLIGIRLTILLMGGTKKKRLMQNCICLNIGTKKMDLIACGWDIA